MEHKKNPYFENYDLCEWIELVCWNHLLTFGEFIHTSQAEKRVHSLKILFPMLRVLRSSDETGNNEAAAIFHVQT